MSLNVTQRIKKSLLNMLPIGLSKVSLSVGKIYRDLLTACFRTTKSETPSTQLSYPKTFDTEEVLLIVAFQRPQRWFNKLWCYVLQDEYSHVRLLSYTWGNYYDTELTWDGYYHFVPVDPTQFDIAFAVYRPCSEEYLLSVFNRSLILRKLELRWSMANALHAFFYGQFPSLSCVSAITYVLHSYISHTMLPSQYLAKLLEE